ncbi:SDR family NAD(P)-dependent oxidoreductase [Streptomyces europaeiscabiei]|uniref:SDR family NAD(P)-dependent oxidoreductase n=1 Tax=Streptomyces europaeiscabiei TaxID=146819 RepID=UPI0029B9DA0A|nr:SDR family NAD(P)-dependent oxidoreductase [Streptomyces europaeiscabiei]MDX3630726.1 SDR family NAD(P)-dependent oxidoreductase [Streptomyces europaeiscabiei]WUD38706.1 SDR family NAD(P)-dependent oxidoreductase [Streptomyces europaeiscabiei]
MARGRLCTGRPLAVVSAGAHQLERSDKPSVPRCRAGPRSLRPPRRDRQQRGLRTVRRRGGTAEQAVRDQLETNLFGALWVTRAALPHLREQGSGHIVQMSSTGGVAAWPLLGGRHASKWALEGLAESLAQEVSGLGIKVTLVEPGAYATDWGGPSAVHVSANPAHDGVREQRDAFVQSLDFGDPTAAGEALLEIVDSDNPPLRVFFGTQGNHMLRQVHADRLKTWADWGDLSIRAQGGQAA